MREMGLDSNLAGPEQETGAMGKQGWSGSKKGMKVTTPVI